MNNVIVFYLISFATVETTVDNKYFENLKYIFYKVFTFVPTKKTCFLRGET